MKAIEQIDFLVGMVPEGWVLTRLTQNPDKTWYCEMREHPQTRYSLVVLSYTKDPYTPTLPSEAVEQCLHQINGGNIIPLTP